VRREQLLEGVARMLVCGLALGPQACTQKHDASAASQSMGAAAGAQQANTTRGAGTVPSATTTASAGGSPAAGAGDTSATSGAAGMASSRPPAASGDAGTSGAAGTAAPPPSHAAMPIDLTGTWISEVKALATETVPLIGQPDANLRLVFRMVMAKSGDRLDSKVEICALSAITTPDPQTLTVYLSDAAIATLTTSVSESAPSVGVGDVVPLPALNVLTGIDASGQPVDSDGDMHPGVTIGANVGILGSLLGYAGMTVKASFHLSMKDENTLAGTGQISSTGVIFGSNNPLLPSATISVTPKMPDVPLTLARIAKDMPCSEVLKQFP